MSRLLLSRQLSDYAERHTTPETKVLAALNRETNMKRGDAVMLSGHLQGALLQMISHMMRPTRILEIGTFTGYSAICLARGLQPGGHLHTIEIDEELYDMAAKYIEQAGLRDRITQHTGDAADIIPSLNEQFDLVFIDAEKSGYGRYFDLLIDRLPIGAFILADNVLYQGEVVQPADEQSKNARAIDNFNKKIAADPRVEQLLLPLRDGMLIMRKIA